MSDKKTIAPIAYIKTDFGEKFGVPRQSGLVDSVAEIIFEPEFSAPEAMRGLGDFSHIWVIWGFSEAKYSGSLTVRPPRLGGNKRMGVFATRSPFRPNELGLSSLRLLQIKEIEGQGTVLIVSGADMKNGTPIYDIKPYLPYTDSHPDAEGGFAEPLRDYRLDVDFPPELLELVPEDKRGALIETLAQDPRPAYQTDPEREYGFPYGDCEIEFKVKNNTVRVFRVTKNFP